jgi:hypothetical protein
MIGEGSVPPLADTGLRSGNVIQEPLVIEEVEIPVGLD